MYMCNHLNLSITDTILVEFCVVSTIYLLLSYLLSLNYKICIKKEYIFRGGQICAYNLAIYMNIKKKTHTKHCD